MSKVFVYPQKEWREFGEVRFCVYWEDVKAEARDKQDIDMDEDIVHRSVVFKSKDTAIAYANKLVDGVDTAFGQATVQEERVDWFEESDRIAEWADVGEPVVCEGTVCA